MGAAEFISITWQTMTCGACGVHFQVPNAFYRERYENGKDWYCPNGHVRVFREREVDRLKRELETVTKRKEWAEQAEKKARHAEAIARGKLKAQTERVKNGVCPCCKRSFQNLRRHMASKHPNWDEPKDPQ